MATAPRATESSPAIGPGAFGNVETVTLKGGEGGPPLQPFAPRTVMTPDGALEEKFTVMFGVPAPEAMENPAGKFQI